MAGVAWAAAGGPEGQQQGWLARGRRAEHPDSGGGGGARVAGAPAFLSRTPSAGRPTLTQAPWSDRRDGWYGVGPGSPAARLPGALGAHCRRSGCRLHSARPDPQAPPLHFTAHGAPAEVWQGARHSRSPRDGPNYPTSPRAHLHAFDQLRLELRHLGRNSDLRGEAHAPWVP